MNIKTVTTVDGVNAVDFGSAASRFYWFRNIGTATVYVSGNSDITAGSDGVAELPAGGSVCIETLGGKVYVLGAGKVQIHNTGDKFCPFRNAPVSSGGGEYIFPSGTEYSAIIELVAGDTVIDKTIGYGFMAKISDVDDRRKLSMCVVDTNGSTVATLTGGTSYPLSSEAYVSRIEVMQKTGNWWYAEVTVKYYSNGELKTTTLTTGTTNKLANFGASGHQISVRNNN